RDSVFLAEGLDPHAPGVVHVPGDHANRAPWRPGNRSVPQGSGQVLHEVRGDAAVGAPCGQKGRAWLGNPGRASTLLLNHASASCLRRPRGTIIPPLTL